MIIFISSFGFTVIFFILILIGLCIVQGFTPALEWFSEHQIGILITVLLVAVIVSIVYTHFDNIESKERGSAGALGYINRILLIPPAIVASVEIIVSLLSDFADWSLLAILFLGIFLLCIGALLSSLILIFVYGIVVAGSQIIYEFTGKIGLVIYTILLAALESYFIYSWGLFSFFFDF